MYKLNIMLLELAVSATFIDFFHMMVAGAIPQHLMYLIVLIQYYLLSVFKVFNESIHCYS